MFIYKKKNIYNMLYNNMLISLIFFWIVLYIDTVDLINTKYAYGIENMSVSPEDCIENRAYL